MNPSLRPGEDKILTFLKDGQKRSFTELQNGTGLSPPSLSQYLRDLQKRKHIARDIDSRAYSITKEGAAEVNMFHFITEGSSLLVVDGQPFGFAATDQDSALGRILTEITDGIVSFGYNFFIAEIYGLLLHDIIKKNPNARKHVEEILRILKEPTVSESQITEVKSHLRKIIPQGKAMISFSFDEGSLMRSITSLLKGDERTHFETVLQIALPKDSKGGSKS